MTLLDKYVYASVYTTPMLMKVFSNSECICSREGFLKPFSKISISRTHQKEVCLISMHIECRWPTFVVTILLNDTTLQDARCCFAARRLQIQCICGWSNLHQGCRGR